MNNTDQQQTTHKTPRQITAKEIAVCDQETIHLQLVRRQMTEQELEGSLSSHQIDSGLSSVRAAALKAMPDVYTGIDATRTSFENADRVYKLHHARGTQFTNSGVPVLKFDIAGSSFESFRTEHRGLKGNGRVRLEDLEDQESKGFSLAEEKTKKELEVSWYNRSKFFNWLPGIKTEEGIRAANERIQSQNAETQARIYAIQNRLNGIIGLPVVLGGRTMEHIHQRVSGNKTRISMAGPLGGVFGLGKGMRNSGDYSIENLRQYMLTIGSEYLGNKFAQWRSGMAPHQISIVIKGHSRGGVACAEGAMMIKQWVSDNYQHYLEYVNFEVTQYDPVPGTGSASGVNEEIDHNSTQTLTASNGDKMMPLGANAETTVFYSMHTEYSSFFTPQQVEGAKRVILTPFTHAVGLGDIEATDITQFGGTKKSELHRPGYTNAKDGEVYRSSGIAELPPGLYMLDEKNTLIRFDTANHALSAFEEVIAGTSFTQKSRHDVLREVIRSYFS